VFVIVNYNACKSVIALYLNVIKRQIVTKVLINPIIRTRTRHFRRAYHPTRDCMYELNIDIQGANHLLGDIIMFESKFNCRK
jgi:hypothetical protein